MKKEFITLMLILIGLTGVKAQDVQLVTLQKGEETQIFYGADAFIEAMAAADHGNTITLTAGTFNATNITKAVTIYGAGYEIHTDSVAQKEGNIAYPTNIIGDFAIALDSVDNKPATGLYIEGIYSNNQITVQNHLEGATFVKCRFHIFDVWKTSSLMMTSKDISFIHCRFASWLEPGDPTNMSVNNCIINYLGRSLNTSSLIIQNSIIIAIVTYLRNATIKNNIIWDVRTSGEYIHNISVGSEYSLHPSCSVYNNTFPRNVETASVTVKGGNWHKVTDLDLFGEDRSYAYNDNEKYELTEEASKKYIGTDGTEIGIYGGRTPFSPILTIPRITKKEIAPKTENGKLKVNIKVEIGNNFL